MTYSYEKVAGVLFFIAASQFILGLVVAEAQYPDYSISTNYISDLGVGSSSIVFNSSVFLMGLLMMTGAYFLQRAFNFRVLTLLLVLTATGAMGVGIFTEQWGLVHQTASLIAFLFGGLSAIASYRLLKLPFSVIAVVLGLMCLGALTLFVLFEHVPGMAGIDFGLGVGGMERMIVYPLLAWGTGFGSLLTGQAEKRGATS
jgi:hypothetical membrane protein